MDRDTLRFIDKIYKDLYKSPEVLKHSSGNETEKFKNLEEYLNKLESVHERAAQSEERIKTIKRMYYNKYVIKKENIPDSYYEHQKRIALEQGYGHVNIDERLRTSLEDEVIRNQKASLDTWIDYFISEDATFYPFWAKYWAFQGMLKMGIYDKEKGTFSKRTNETAAPFIDLNREALSKSMDLVIKMIGKETIDDRELEMIVKSGSFPKIYQHVLKNILSDNKKIIKSNQGKWVKYDQGSDHMILVNSLQGYNTGWCTAGESTAKYQLGAGDFYVYYTLNEKNEYKVPRIAIRMNGYEQIGEIRGIGLNQNIEPEMEKVVEEKLKDFPDRDKYYKKVEDMKKLTEIYDRHSKTKQLTISDLRFLYEVDDDIKGFGYFDDPRIREILFDRDVKEDLSKIFNCKPSQVATKSKEIKKDTICYLSRTESTLDLSYCQSVEDFDFKTSNKKVHLPKYVFSNLDLKGLEDATGIEFPEYIKGSLILSELPSAKSLVLPKRLSGNLLLNSLKKVDKLVLPETMDGYIDMPSLERYSGQLEFPKSVEYLRLNKFRKLDSNIIFPRTIRYSLVLPSVTEIHDFVFPIWVGGQLQLKELKTAENVVFPTYVGGGFDAKSLKSIKKVEFPQYMEGDLKISLLKEFDELKLPREVYGYIFLDKITEINGNVTFPEFVERGIFLDYLVKVENVKFPKLVGGSMCFPRLLFARNTIFPERINEDLVLPELREIENVTFPERVDQNIKLSHLACPKPFEIPKFVGGIFTMTKYQAKVLEDQIKNSKYPISVRYSQYNKVAKM